MVSPHDEVWTLAQYNAYLAGAQSQPQTPRFIPLDAEAAEDALEERIRQLCAVTGHLYYHTRKSKGSTPGWPDDAIVHPTGGALYLWENKRTGETPSPAQRRWLDALRRVTHVEVATMYPADWGRITTLLTRHG